VLTVTDALSHFIGMSQEDFIKSDGDGVMLIQGLQSMYKCSVIVRSGHATR